MLFLQLLLNGLQTGAIYALTAAGFALIFGATKIFHVAHGTAFTIAGYVFLFAWRAGLARLGGHRRGDRRRDAVRHRHGAPGLSPDPAA